jgi:hypothetical protein
VLEMGLDTIPSCPQDRSHLNLLQNLSCRGKVDAQHVAMLRNERDASILESVIRNHSDNLRNKMLTCHVLQHGGALNTERTRHGWLPFV